MSTPSTTPQPAGPDAGTGRPVSRRLTLAAAATAVVAAVVAAVTLGGGGSPPSAAGADASPTGSTATTSAPAGESAAPTTAAPVPSPQTPTPTGPTSDADEGPPELPVVPLDAPAPVGNGVVATLPRIESIDASATGPGNIAGPALRVTVQVTNGTAEPLSLGGVVTNLYLGPDRTPASPVDDPSRAPFTGTVAPGASATGVYVFTVPADARSAVTVEVGYEAGAPLLQFTGPVG
ncbi:hypothetical protein GCU67_11800 [Modestobacter muralis]|uniref:DUF4352 domain-containing protein n=1 Tax=Modestobacter muralis TaxID=1608614 RepID=A0A6P0HA76_9ACTN|nr:hypothetical protein [Modestobacter muralis]NEK94848.1 hypothetical protein [Modestobacter muralis]NEN51736.1 hypothetical protein [Modestobacter muralis]